jgi:hypothetical protein
MAIPKSKTTKTVKAKKAAVEEQVSSAAPPTPQSEDEHVSGSSYFKPQSSQPGEKPFEEMRMEEHFVALIKHGYGTYRHGRAFYAFIRSTMFKR